MDFVKTMSKILYFFLWVAAIRLLLFKALLLLIIDLLVRHFIFNPNPYHRPMIANSAVAVIVAGTIRLILLFCVLVIILIRFNSG